MKKISLFNYNVKNSGERLDVFIDGTIVDAETQEILKEWWNDDTSVSFKSFRSQILDSGLKNIRITINSFGGQIGDAMAMHDFIQQLERDGYAVETIGMGMICSAATYVLSAAKNSKISLNSWYMIHNVSGCMCGDVNEMEKQIRQLRKFNDDIRDFYANLTGQTADQIEKWMNAETWFTGKEAVENGFVNATTEDKEDFKPINKTDWNFKNTTALNVFNQFASNPPHNNNDNFENLDMKKLIESIVNGLKSHNVFVTDNNANPKPMTVENFTTALTDALKDVDLEPKEPTEEQVNTALTNFFKDGLPENMITQISNAVKGNSAPVNFKESEEYKDLSTRMEDLEDKAAKNFGQAVPARNKGNNQVTDQYEADDIGWGE